MRKLRISAISFLNTAPLMWDFAQGKPPRLEAGSRELREEDAIHPQLFRDFEVEYTIPSLCAEQLRSGAADIGLIPVAAYTGIPGLIIIPDVAIAAQGPVRSILLASQRPLDQVRTLAADSSSRTSVALLQVLFHLWHGRVPSITPAMPDLDVMLRQCEAALVIGDPALRIDRTRYQTWDLAEEWQQITGKPFVFAFWAIREKALQEVRPSFDLATIFQASRNQGLKPEHLQTIAREWSPVVQLDEREIIQYLKTNIHYWLDRESLAGLQLFFQYAQECGVLKGVPRLRFLDE